MDFTSVILIFLVISLFLTSLFLVDLKSDLHYEKAKRYGLEDENRRLKEKLNSISPDHSTKYCRRG